MLPLLHMDVAGEAFIKSYAAGSPCVDKAGYCSKILFPVKSMKNRSSSCVTSARPLMK